MTADSTRTARSLGGGNPDVVRSQNLRIRKFSLDIDALETGFFPRNGLENDVVLIREHLLQTVQVRSIPRQSHLRAWTSQKGQSADPKSFDRLDPLQRHKWSKRGH